LVAKRKETELKRLLIALLLSLVFVFPAHAGGTTQDEVLSTWYQLILKLVRHTATYSPPVASRAFAYLGVTSFEATASGDAALISLDGQLNGLKGLPKRERGKTYDEAIVLNAALGAAARDFFANTGPSGQNALKTTNLSMRVSVAKGVAADVRARSEAFGLALEKHIFKWSQGDGGAKIVNLGFPLKYKLSKEPGHWQPTNQQTLQHVPLLPSWGKNRSFAMPDGATCILPPPPAYSEDKASEFYKQAQEVHDVKNGIGEGQRLVARFWSDDPGLSTTPPGHWIEITLAIAARDKLSIAKTSDALARLGVAVADAFIGCWHEKYKYDYIRPVTFIKAHIDPNWETVLITPPFPEYPSGHSSQSGAAATVLSSVLGDNLAFDDASHEKDNLGVRHFNSFWDAAKEAAVSRLYGGIHFRAAIDQGLEQGKCIGAYAVKLRTVK
jgi:PAP2 superfamily